MDKTQKTAQESEEVNSFAGAGEYAAPGRNSAAENDAEFQDTSESKTQGGEPAGFGAKDDTVNGAHADTSAKGEPAKESGAEKKAQKAIPDKEQNAENARRRREAEFKAKLEEARREAIISALGGKNPYTGEEMSDAEDVAEFLRMQRIEKEGGDPVADYARTVKEETRKKAVEEKARAEQEQWYRDDREAFLKKFPEVDLDALVQNKLFSSYANGKVGKMPLSEIYEGFLSLTGEYEKRAGERAAQILANKNASPGPLAGAEAGDAGFFTREQVKGMSKDEVHRNYEKIMESMKRWK